MVFERTMSAIRTRWCSRALALRVELTGRFQGDAPKQGAGAATHADKVKFVRWSS